MEENELLYKNITKLDDEEIALFQNFALKKINFIASIAFALVFVALGVGLSFVDLTIGIVLIVSGLLGGFVLLPYLMKESTKRQNRENLGDKKYLNTYDFYEDYLFVSSEATTSKDTNDYSLVATQKIMYSDLFKQVVYKERLFIYINPRQSFILNFQGMKKGTIAETIEHLKNKGLKTIDKTNLIIPKK